MADAAVALEVFSIDATETVIKSAIGSVLSDTSYKPIISAALKGLQSLNRPYKYAITVIVMQKNGAGLVSAASTYWDTSKDGLCKVVWENGTMHCVVTVYGTCVNIDPEDAERQDAAVSFATTIP